MNYDEIDADAVLTEIETAIAEGRTRPATKQEIMRIRLAALAAIVRSMQETVEKDYQLEKAGAAHL